MRTWFRVAAIVCLCGVIGFPATAAAKKKRVKTAVIRVPTTLTLRAELLPHSPGFGNQQAYIYSGLLRSTRPVCLSKRPVSVHVSDNGAPEAEDSVHGGTTDSGGAWRSSQGALLTAQHTYTIHVEAPAKPPIVVKVKKKAKTKRIICEASRSTDITVVPPNPF